SFMIKEPAVLLFPAVWLLSMPWRTTAAIRLRQLALGAVGLFPFLVYYAVRVRGANRPVAITLGRGLFAVERFSTWWHRVLAQFGWTGIVVPVALIAYSVVAVCTLRHDQRT